MHRRHYTFFVFAILLLLASVSSAQQIIIDHTADGSQYELAMPATWNGTLVVYAHGIVDPQAPIAVPHVEPLRDALLFNGYAMAYSSFSTNGYAVKDGIQRTHQLKGLFTAHFSKPRRTILMGHSLGGLVVLALAERYPAQYDGALPMCGVLGGSTPEVNYVANGRALYDLFFSSGKFGSFPYKLPGDAGNPVLLDFSPTSEAFNGVIQNLTLGFAPPSFLTLQFAATVPIPVNLADPNEVIAGAMNLVGFHVRFGSDLIERTHDRVPFDNTNTVYSDPFAPTPDFVEAINEFVQRFQSTPDAANYLKNNYTPTGRLKIPVVTLHTTRDPVVPIWHEDLYRALADKAGSGNLLVQTSVDAYGHCNFTDAETFAAFAKLVMWVETGVKPAP